MSWLTAFVRGVGLGPVLDTIEKAEANPSPQSIEAAIGSVVTALPQAANIAIPDLGRMAESVVVGAVSKVNPGAGAVAASIVGPLLAELELVAEKWLAAATGGVA